MNKYKVALILLVLAAPVGSADSLSLRVEYNNQQELQSRVLLSWLDIRFVYLDVLEFSSAEHDWIMGFDSFFLVTGPLKARGLLREIFNPSGYSPSSVVYTEVSALVLDISLKKPGEYGVCWRVVPGWLSLFLLPREEHKIYGALLNIAIEGANCLCYLDVFCGSTKLAEEKEPERWYLEEALFPGGRLFNLSFRAGLSASALALSASGGFSWGEYETVGFFLSARGEWDRDLIELAALLVFCSPEYRDLDADFQKTRLKVAGVSWLKAHPLCWLGFEFTDSLKKAYETVYLDILEPDIFIAARAKGGYSYGKKIRFSYSLNAEWDNLYQSEEAQDFTFSVNSQFTTGYWGLSGEYIFKLEGVDEVNRVGVDIFFDNDFLFLQCGYKQTTPGARIFKIRAELNGRIFHWFVRFEFEREFAFTLGCDAVFRFPGRD